MSLLVASEADFEKALDENPDDWNMRLMYSDWLQEQGQDDRATFLRLVVRQEKRPDFDKCHDHETPWGWSSGIPATYQRHLIGERLFIALPVIYDLEQMTELEFRTAEGRGVFDSGHSWFLTRQSAERALYNAWLAAGKPNNLS
jgi:uncharacterized protein (TIGR02996 family)